MQKLGSLELPVDPHIAGQTLVPSSSKLDQSSLDTVVPLSQKIKRKVTAGQMACEVKFQCPLPTCLRIIVSYYLLQ